jgi:hypothetical protein
MYLSIIFVPLLVTQAPAPVARAESRPRLPMLANDVAWKRLPGAPASSQPLPAWARMLADPLPITTARMLELDALHRTGDRLDARLRALARWAAADANKCGYAKVIAAADFARAGGDRDEIKVLVKNPDRLCALDRMTVVFARKMMLEAHAVTDDEVKNLIELAGPERVVALVALLGHASFQDRVLLALNADAEAPHDPPPLVIKFGRPELKGPPPGTAAVHNDTPPPSATKLTSTSEWLRLQERLDQQRARTGRIRVPSREEVLKRLGKQHPAAWQAGIVWSRVCYGYQPELTDAWFDCTTGFRQDTHMDRLFQNSIFWVVTDALQCFY